MKTICTTVMLLLAGCNAETDYAGTWLRDAVEPSYVDDDGNVLAACSAVLETLELHSEGTFTQVVLQEPALYAVSCEGVPVETTEAYTTGTWTPMVVDDDGTSWIAFEAEHFTWIRENEDDSVDTDATYSWVAEAALGERDEQRVLFLQSMGQYLEAP